MSGERVQFPYSTSTAKGYVLVGPVGCQDGKDRALVARDGSREPRSVMAEELTYLQPPAPTPPKPNGWVARPGVLADWSYIGSDNPEEYGTPRVVSNPTGGGDVAELYHPPGSEARHRKFYASFIQRLWPNASLSNSFLREPPPSDVSGTYYANILVPSDWTPATWMQVAQFKEDYLDAQGVWHSDPRWWAGLTTEYGGLHLNFTAPSLDPSRVFGHTTAIPVDYRPFLDKWTRVELVVKQGVSVTLLVNGAVADTAKHSEYPVGPFIAFAELREEDDEQLNWTFGVGAYGDDSPANLAKGWGMLVGECGLVVP